MNPDVVVVGCGPVGMFALNLLGHLGLTAVGIEREREVWTQARAVSFDDETLRSLQGIGLGEEVAALIKPMCDFRMENEAGETLIAHATGVPGPQGWHTEVLFHQPEIDALLRAEAARLPGIELRLGSTLLSLEQHGASVRSVFRDVDGTEQSLVSRWVLACDGARSTVRQLLGIQRERIGSDDPWLVVDGLLRGPAPIPGDMVFIGRHTRPALWVDLPGDRVRMEFKVMDGDDPEEIVTADGIARLSRGVLTSANFEPERRAIYTFRARVADKWRVGNVFLAGDAAHQAPPLFGMGLCAGIRDISNLVWKLRWVADEKAGDELLDTYQTERRPHARYWVEQASTMASTLQTTDPAVAARRDEYIRAHPAATKPGRPPLGPGLHAGSGNPHAGHLSIQPSLADGRRLDDVTGHRLLVAGSPELLGSSQLVGHPLLRDTSEVSVLRDHETARALLGHYGCEGLVIRPDRYILGTANTPAEFDQLLRLIPAVENSVQPA